MLVTVVRADASAIGRAWSRQDADARPARDDRAPRPGDWATYNGDISGNRHSTLPEITPANVRGLRLAWTFAVPGARYLRTTPLVVGGVMYVTAPNEVFALDAYSGRQIWHFRQPARQA